MKTTVELQGRHFDSRQALRDRFGVSASTVQRWKEKGWLPQPLCLGKAEFYDRQELEARLAQVAE
jgi:hypothetical protein